MFERNNKSLPLRPINSGTTLLRRGKENMYDYFMTENATAHTTDFSKAAQEEVFGKMLLS
jgi:hypothetical protein